LKETRVFVIKRGPLYLKRGKVSCTFVPEIGKARVFGRRADAANSWVWQAHKRKDGAPATYVDPLQIVRVELREFVPPPHIPCLECGK
jgi:hypothetical protein